MDEEEKEGLSMCEILWWFESKGIKLNTEWLSAVLSYLGRKATIKSVFEQFVFSRLEESYERPMKIPDKAAKIVLTKIIVFQILSLVNIARPIFEQLKDELRTDNNLTWFYGEKTEEDEMEGEGNEILESRGRECTMLTLTDGMTTLKAIDYGRVEGLNDHLPIGTKLMMVDRVMCRRGVMVLKKTNCTILGGAFEVDGNELTKAERLSKMLPTTKRSKIEPYLSRVKKEFDLNQRTISPFLRRLPQKESLPPPPPPPSLPPSPSIPPHTISPPMENTLVPALMPPPSFIPPRPLPISSTMHMPPPSMTRGRSPPRPSRIPQARFPPAAVVEPTVKIEEIDPDLDASVMCIEKAVPSHGDKRLDDSLNTTVVSNQRRILPIIPSTAHIEMESSQMDPLNHSRGDIPQRPCVKLTPHTLAERIEASQSRGRIKEMVRKTLPSSTTVGKDANRSIASYFQASKMSEPRWNKKTQMVEPSSRGEREDVRREMEEGIEEGRKKEELEKRMAEDREKRERKEREERFMRDEDERRRIYYDQMRRRDDDERKRREEEEQRRMSYGNSNPHVSVVVMSTPTPCSYITPPSGFVTLPQSNEIEHLPLMHPSSHLPSHSHSHEMEVEMPPPVRHASSGSHFLLFGGESRPSVPMNLFGSPVRIHPSANHNIIPFKKTKIEEQKMGDETMEQTGERGERGFSVEGRRTNHIYNPLQNVQPPLHCAQGGMRSGYSSELQYPQSSMYQPWTWTNSMIPSMGMERGMV
ncbi:hypothetical protein PENTCL1PPCAC_22942, partial [Pristionchus entomophagus]